MKKRYILRRRRGGNEMDISIKVRPLPKDIIYVLDSENGEKVLVINKKLGGEKKTMAAAYEICHHFLPHAKELDLEYEYFICMVKKKSKKVKNLKKRFKFCVKDL